MVILLYSQAVFMELKDDDLNKKSAKHFLTVISAQNGKTNEFYYL